MANLQERRDKNGKLISYSIRVHRGRDSLGRQLKPYTATFEVNPSCKEETARKKTENYAAVFEKECKEGIRNDTRIRFDKYCDYVIELKEHLGIKHSTIVRYKSLTERIYEHIGHIKLLELRADHLNEFYNYLLSNNLNKRTGGKLNAKTVLEHHRLISTVLEQALKEALVPFNVAKRATPPKIKRNSVNYFQPEEIIEICKALENEPIKWRTLVHLFLITGARRGEILALKWENIDWDKKQIFINSNLLYSPDVGIYITTPKTEKSIRYISIPDETIRILKEYQEWQNEQKEYFGSYFEDQGFVFCRDNGMPFHPDSVTDYMNKLSTKYNLPHINPHAFRHTMASVLYHNGVNSVSVSGRLGHAQVSTTANIYAHLIDDADKHNSQILSDVFFKNSKS